MRNKHRARTRHLIILAIVVLLSTVAPALHAGGRKEDRLSKADQLITDRRYTDAILALTAFIKESPERFDEAQRRLQRIVRLRDEYNATASELLDVLVNDPTNDERKLEMIRRLEALETAPNRAAREFISRTKETALFTFNKARFEAIMLAGRALIDKKDYPGAVRKYAEGSPCTKRNSTQRVMASLWFPESTTVSGRWARGICVFHPSRTDSFPV